MRKGRLIYTTLPFPTVPNTGRWVPKEWNGLDVITNTKNINGRGVWTDGTNIYYSWSQYQLVLHGNTWEPKEWNIDGFYGYAVWTDGKNIYLDYPYGNAQHYVLVNGIWEPHSWNVEIDGEGVWSDGENIYCTLRTTDVVERDDSYVLKDGIWEPKAWNGLDGVTDFYGSNIWSDGVNIYHDMNYMYSKHAVLVGDTWQEHNWNIKYVDATKIWTDGVNIYCNLFSSPSFSYVLQGDAWERKEWDFYPADVGCIWTDGVNIYYSLNEDQYVLERTQPQDLDPSSMLIGWLAGRAVAGQRLHVKQ